MTHTPSSLNYEEGFLILLLLLSLGSLIWLFEPFLPSLFLAVLLASSTHPQYQRLKIRFQLSDNIAALIMTLLVLVLVVSPIIYLLASTGLRIAQETQNLREWTAQFSDAASLQAAVRAKLVMLPIPETFQDKILLWVAEHKAQIGDATAKGILSIFRNISDNGLAFFSSLVLILFSLFFFYRDGAVMVNRIMILSPLPNRYDSIILNRFAALATVLTSSTLAIALMQGLSFSLISIFLGLPWFYLGVAVAVGSFIPLIGGFIVWGPLAWFLFHDGHPGTAIFVAFWGAVVNGFVIDNLVRPLLIQRLTAWQPSSNAGGDIEALGHTLLTVLSTLGGVLAFGIMGLFFGPMIAAMAITIFDVYEMKHGHWLDQSAE